MPCRADVSFRLVPMRSFLAAMLLLPLTALAEPVASEPALEPPAVAAVSIDPAAPAPASPDVPMPATEAPANSPPVVAEPPPPPVPRSPMEQEIWNVARTTFPRELLTQLYLSRDWRPLWTNAGAARELVAAIRDSYRQGLSPKAYGIDELEPLVEQPAASLRRDVLLSRAFSRLAFDLRFGRIPVSKFGAAAATTKRLADGDNPAELAAAIETGKVGEFLERMQPPFALYKRLGIALERYRKLAADGGWKPVESGSPLRPGTHDRRVPQVRKRLVASGDFAGSADDASDLYDGELVESVKSFQARHGLERDGVAGRQTIEAMNVPPSRRVDQIRATMERTRQFLHDLPSRFVVVNIASFSIYLIDGGQPVWSSRIIVGKPDLETPVFRTNIDAFILNPEWNVPPSIVKDELLPGLAKDPKKLEKMRIRRIGERYVQTSGAHNSLGRIKFSMPNEHAVYLHDTPSKGLFERRERAFSHGCVRVEHPFELAAHLLADPARDAAALEKEMLAGKTKTVRLREPVPVLVMTWSVVVAADGRVDFLTDLYGHDAEVLAGLDGTPLPPAKKIAKPAPRAPVPGPSPASAPAPAPAPSEARATVPPPG
jgi:murein L,D-transpeptidase YcbB/YkuD